MVSQTVCYTGVCTYSSTVLLVVFCLHFLQSLICFVQQFLNVLSVLLLHLKLLLLKLSHLVIQLKGVKFICVLNIVLIKIPALRLEKRRDRVKQNKQTKRKESWYFSLFVFFETPNISFACFAHQYFHLKSVITERIRGVDIRTLLFFNQLILNFMNFIEYHVALTMLTLLLIVTLITNLHSDTIPPTSIKSSTTHQCPEKFARQCKAI